MDGRKFIQDNVIVECKCSLYVVETVIMDVVDVVYSDHAAVSMTIEQ